MPYSFDMRKQLRAESSSRSYVAPWYEKEPDACRFFDIPVYDQAEDAHYRMKESCLLHSRNEPCSGEEQLIKVD